MPRSPAEKRILGLLGPRSTSAQRWQEQLPKVRADVPEEFQSVIGDSDAAWPANAREWNALSSRMYLVLLARSLLLASTGDREVSCIEFVSPAHVPPLHWLDAWADHSSWAEVAAIVQKELVDSPELFSIDPLRILHEAFLPAVVRKKRGEHFTPEWLADLVLDSVWNNRDSILDPTAGGGAFPLAIARRCRAEKENFPPFVGLEQDPFSFVACAASITWGRRISEGRHAAKAPISLFWANVLTPMALPIERFQSIVGNPPWVLWDRYSIEERQAMAGLWQAFGLQTESGMRSILGGGKRDVAALIALVSADRWLRDKGRLAFVAPISLFKSSTSARGFRRFTLPDGTDLSIDFVHDLSRLRVFPNAAVRTTVFRMTKGIRCQYPVRYSVWKDPFSVQDCEAAPSDPRDLMSCWRHRPVLSSEPMDLSGPCDYVAHLGVNTGGANGVYWFDRMGSVTPALWQMANLGSRGKKCVPIHSIPLEADFLYPVLIGKDVRAWNAIPSAWLLMVQDPRRKRGIEIAELERLAPRCLAYLRSHEAILRGRAAFRRYFLRPHASGATRETGPFYSMFNVGEYTLAPWKVVWNRMGHRMAAAVVGSMEDRSILPQETHAFFGVAEEREAYYLAALLNSRQVQAWLESLTSVGAKSFATPGVIHSLRLAQFRSDDSLHQRLAWLGESASRVTPEAAVGQELLAELDRWTTEYWT